MTTRITPAFLLKGIDPLEVLRNYQNGLYTRPLKKKTAIQSAHNTSILAPTYGSTNQSPIFSIKDRNNSNIVVATSNHKSFEVFTTTGGQVSEGGRCDFCKKDFEHEAIGYPVGYKEMSLIATSNDSDSNTIYRTVYVFWVEGCHCSFECALGYVESFLNQPSSWRDNSMTDSKRLLKLLYKLTYPDKAILRAAQDPRLLKSNSNTNSGSLSHEEWSDTKHRYVRTDRVLMIPAKVEYFRTNFDNHITLSVDVSTANYSTVIPSP